MSYTGTRTIAQGKKAVTELLNEINTKNWDWNEAETRFQIIDRIIVDCLGWPREEIRLEQPKDGKFSDYELGNPRRIIWEAKREGKTFELPANSSKNLLCDLSSIISLDEEINKAIKQVQSYCIARGVELAVVCNGKQLLAFFATRTDGQDPLKCKCFVVDGYEQLNEKFPQIWQMLSPDGILERKMHRFLKVGEDVLLPEKMSHYLHDYPKFRYASDLQHSLRNLSELLLNDIIDHNEVQEQFYKECYCDSGALSQHALISKQMLASRYTALFNPSEASPVVTPATQKDGQIAITPEVIATSMMQRPIVLIGDVGVGKTSFLKHLMLISASKEFRESIYLHLNLGSQGALSANLNDFVLSELERQLFKNYNVDIRENNFVKGVYDIEIKRFERGIYAELKESNPSLYSLKLLEFLESKTKYLDQHLRSSIEHLAKARRKQIIIALDNADQRKNDVQQEAFIIAQNFAKDWYAVVFITVRPHTFFQSKKSGTLSAYPPRVFAISPPRVDQVVEKRLLFALNIAEGRIKMQNLQGVSLNLSNIAIFIKALLFSLNRNEKLVEFLANITGGNIREIIEFVSRFIGSANVDADKIIQKMSDYGSYLIPLHEFWKAALIGEYSHFDPVSSMALNIFDITNANTNEHFLLPMILGFLNIDGKHKTKEGFVTISNIVSEMQNWGFSPSSTSNSIQRANNKKLIETSQRVTYDEGDAMFYENVSPENFRLTTIGAYHLKRWITEFAYIDAMSHDTPILDEDSFKKIRDNINSLAISDRYNRASTFRAYLTKCWHDTGFKPSYFDWLDAVDTCQDSFDKVKKVIEEI